MRSNLLNALLLVGVLAMAGCASHSASHANRSSTARATGFINMTTALAGVEQPCVLYVPRDYEPTKAWPLVVFLHGMGERGNDGLRQTAVGIGPTIQLHPGRFPCLVLMPQCPTDSLWVTSDAAWARDAKSAAGHIDDGIRQVLES